MEPPKLFYTYTKIVIFVLHNRMNWRGFGSLSMELGGKFFITFCLYYIITIRKISIGEDIKD